MSRPSPRRSCNEDAPRRVALLLWLLFLSLAALHAPHQRALAAEQSPGSAPLAIVLELRGPIGPAAADYFARGLEQARERDARVVILRLDTPGGLDTSMREIIQAILASRVPVVAHVAPEGARAASAGTYILYAAHVAAMAPATTLGAATPVAIGLPAGGRTERDKEDAPADPMAAKQVNDAAAFIRGLAGLHGRNAEWAERAVREAVSLTADEALRDGVIDLVAHDVPGLLAAIDGRGVRMEQGRATLRTAGLSVEEVLPDWRHRLLSVLANPGFALILLMLGFYGIVLEFSSPGMGFAGIAGAICLVLALFALQLLPVNYAGLALIALGLGLLVAELFTPSFGVLGVGGVIAFVAGGILLFDRDVPGFGVPLVLILGLAASSAAVVLLGGGMALKSRRRPVVSGAEAMIGAAGKVIEAGPDEAWALVGGERWRIGNPRGLRVGQRVRVAEVRGLALEVRPEPDAGSTGDRQ